MENISAAKMDDIQAAAAAVVSLSSGISTPSASPFLGPSVESTDTHAKMTFTSSFESNNGFESVGTHRKILQPVKNAEKITCHRKQSDYKFSAKKLNAKKYADLTNKKAEEDEEEESRDFKPPFEFIEFKITTLAPYPFFYYEDHSQVPDQDPLSPLTPPGRVPNFPAKMYAILSDPELADVIAWMPHGRSWRVLKPREFEIQVIPKFFEHSKFSSFIRQANGWGFRRITQGPDRNSYYNELFLRGLPHLCKKMKRPGVAEKTFLDPKHEPDFYKISEIYPLPKGDHEDESISYQISSSQGPKERIPVNFGAFDATKPDQFTSNQVFSSQRPKESIPVNFGAADATKSLTQEAEGQSNPTFQKDAEIPEKNMPHSPALPNYNQHFIPTPVLNDRLMATPSYYGTFQQMAHLAMATRTFVPTDARPQAKLAPQDKTQRIANQSAIKHFVHPTDVRTQAEMASRGKAQGNVNQLSMQQFVHPASQEQSTVQTLSVACHLNAAANHLRNALSQAHHQQLHSTNSDRDLAMYQIYRELFQVRQNHPTA